MYVVVIVDSYCVGSLSLRTIDRHTGNMAKTTALCVYLLSPPLSLSLSHSHSLFHSLSPPQSVFKLSHSPYFLSQKHLNTFLDPLESSDSNSLQLFNPIWFDACLIAQPK